MVDQELAASVSERTPTLQDCICKSVWLVARQWEKKKPMAPVEAMQDEAEREGDS